MYCICSINRNTLEPKRTGVAALLLSYFPDLSPEEVKDIIETSAVPHTINVHKPGTEELVPFKSLSKTGKLVNAYKAVQLAIERSK